MLRHKTVQNLHGKGCVFLFAGGLLAAFILFIILYMAGAGQWLCIGFGAVSASSLVWLTFRLNAKYGEHGLMKLGAARMRCSAFSFTPFSLRKARSDSSGYV